MLPAESFPQSMQNILVLESKKGKKNVPPLSSVEAIPMLKISGR